MAEHPVPLTDLRVLALLEVYRGAFNGNPAYLAKETVQAGYLSPAEVEHVVAERQAAARVLRGHELQFSTQNPDGTWRPWTSTHGPANPHIGEGFIRLRYINDAANDYAARDTDEYGDVRWRIVRVLEEEVEPPRTSQEVVEWFTAEAPGEPS